SGSTTTAGASDPSDSSSAAAPASIDGAWKVTSGSQAGYRVNEVLLGQKTKAVGRTDQVTGQMTISGTKVTDGSWSVDMARVTSDKSQRDNQYRTRVMDVESFPTSTFKLTSPIDLGTLPAEGKVTNYKATGQLTLHGTTKTVTLDIQAQRSGANIKVLSNVPI